MIAQLTGTVVEKLLDEIVLDVHGVGYGVLITAEDYGQLSTGTQVKLSVYEHIREQSHDLYGFLALDTKRLFVQLLEVNGVGPKMALSMLSIGTASDVRRAIASGDTKTIQQANGVGKRVAERVVVELKDKVGLPGVDLASTDLLQSSRNVSGDEAIEALMALGYSPQDAARAMQTIDATLPVEERVKQALKAKG